MQPDFKTLKPVKPDFSTLHPIVKSPVIPTQPTETYGALFPSSTTDNPVVAGTKALGNLPTSAFNLAKGLSTAITHPIQTGKGIRDVIAGATETGLNKVFNKNVQTQETQTFQLFTDLLKERYGSLENLQRTATNDPVGFGTDVMSLLQGGASLLGKSGQLENVISKTGQLVTKPANKIISGVGEIGAQTLGVSTGAGASSIKEAAKGNKVFFDALKGNVNPDEIVKTAQDAVQNIVSQRRSAYLTDLAKIGENKISIDISPVYNTLDRQLKDFGVKVSQDGGLDFSRSAIASNGSARTDIQGIYDILKNWGTQPGDRTPVGLDILKKQLGDFYSESGSARAFVQAIKSNVDNILKTQVPEYSTMTKKYSEASSLLNDIKSATGIGGKAKIDTIYTKLTTAMKADKNLRLEILNEVSAKGAEPDLMAKIAGTNMQSFIPQGLVGKGADIAILLHYFNPTALATLLLTSPKIVGSFVYGLGLGAEKSKVIVDLLNKVSKTIPTAGVANNLLKTAQSKPQ